MSSKSAARWAFGAHLGTLEAVDPNGVARVVCEDNAPDGPIYAHSTVSLGSSDVGQRVVLVFEHADPSRPIVVGVLRNSSVAEKSAELSSPLANPVVEADGEKLVLTAQREIVLRCGEASITLTRAGKILIHGAYVLSRSSGVNKIKGGSVQIN